MAESFAYDIVKGTVPASPSAGTVTRWADETGAGSGMRSVDSDSNVYQPAEVPDGSTKGEVARTGDGSFVVIQHKLDAAVAPTVNDDSSAGYAAKSVWIDTVGVEIYDCLDPSVGAAVWHKRAHAGTTALASLAIAGEQVTSGTLPDARIQASGVTQHEGSITHNNLTGITTGDPHTQYLLRTEVLLDNLNASVAPTVNDDSSAGYAKGSRWFDGVALEIYDCLSAGVGAAVWRKRVNPAEKGAASGYASLDANSELAQTCPAEKISPGHVTETGTTRTASDSDHGKTIWFTNAAGCTYTFNTGLRADFWAKGVQRGAGQVTVAEGTATLKRAATFATPIKTKEQQAAFTVEMTETANDLLVTGVLAAA